MKARYVAVCGFIVFGVCVGCATASLYLYGGGEYTIGYPIFEPLFVDYLRPTDGTRVEMADGGVVHGHMETDGISQVTISGGQIGAHLSVQDDSTVRIDGGAIGGPIFTSGNSRVEVSGGRMNGLHMDGASCAQVSGGVFTAIIWVQGRGTVVLAGRDFSIDGRPVGYGDSARDYSLNGQLTGILASGEILNNRYTITDLGDIRFVPEPATGVILGVGSLLVLRRKRSIRNTSDYR